MTIELGISTFGETTLLESTGKSISHDQRIRELVEEIELSAHSWGWIEENNFQKFLLRLFVRYVVKKNTSNYRQKRIMTS